MADIALAAHACHDHGDALVAAHAVDLADAGSSPEWVHLVPAGAFRGRDGRGPYRADPAAVIGATLAYQGGADIPIDYDHQILHAQANGRPAVAAGWIKQLEARDDGIWGRVEWTEAAAKHIAAREYRYLSPVFAHHRDGSVARVAFAALVNNPNLHLTALNSQGASNPMDEFLKFLAMILGLPEDASQATIEAHARQLAGQVSAHAAAVQAIARAMKLDEKATAEQIVAHAQTLAAGAAQPDPAQYVAMSAFTEVQTQLAALQTRIATDDARLAVNSAATEGKVTPAMRTWAEGYAEKDLAGFQAWVAAAPAIVAPGTAAHAAKPPAADRGVDADDLTICRQMGLSPEAYAKTMKEA